MNAHGSAIGAEELSQRTGVASSTVKWQPLPLCLTSPGRWVDVNAMLISVLPLPPPVPLPSPSLPSLFTLLPNARLMDVSLSCSC